MTDNNTNEQIRARIDAFLKDIGGLVNQTALTAVQDALSGRSPAKRRRRTTPRAARRGPARPKVAAAKPARRSGGRIRRSTEAVEKMADRFHHYVKGHPGQGIEQISKGLNIASKELKLPVVKLLASKKLHTQGQKRGTRYFAGAKRSARKSARKTVRKAKRVVRRPRRVAKRAIRRKALPAKKAAKRVMKRAPRKAAQKVVAPKVTAPKTRPAAKKPVVAPETPSIASALAERVAVAG